MYENQLVCPIIINGIYFKLFITLDIINTTFYNSILYNYQVPGMDGEPPQKKSRTDYKLCLVCQKDDRQNLVDTSYRTFNEKAYNFSRCTKESKIW